MNGGHGATIQKEDWEDAMNATGAPNRISARDLERRDNGGGQEGQIEKLSTNVFCYGTGAVARTCTFNISYPPTSNANAILILR